MPTYSSSTISASLTQTIRGELLFPIPIDYDLPEGFFISDISQADADDQAEFYFNELTASTDATAYTVQQRPGVSATTVVFTHELKFEDNPVYLPVAYLNTGQTGIISGTTLYYDSDGKFKVLNGFYNEKLSSGYYSVFYETLYGVVVERYFMLNSNSTSVTAETTGNVYNLVQTLKDYTSSWYFGSTMLPEISYDEVNNFYNFNQIWGTNDFYNNPIVRRGFVDNPSEYNTLYLWDSNFNLNSYSAAANSYYREIPDIFNVSYITYTTATTLTINIVQNCSADGNNGLYFRTFDSNGNNSPSLVGVSFQASIYTASTFDSTHTIVIGEDTNEAFLSLPTSYIGQITSVTILSYNSPNPANKVTFTSGTFTACNVATATPTPVVSPSNSPTPSITPTNTLTPSITPTNTLTPSITVTKTATVTPTQTQLAIQYNTDLTNYSTATLACRNGVQGANNKYMSPSYLAPESGAYVYNESSLSTLYDGGDQYHRMFRGASSWAVRIGTGGLISDVVDCSTIPSDTPTPTPTATPTITPTNTITPSTSSLGSSIQLSTPQNDECVACRLTSYSQTRYVNPSDSTPTIGDIVYQNVELTTVFNGNSQWFKTSWGSPTEYSIQIATNGQVLDVTNCSTCPTQTPSPTETPTPTPTSIPESPTPTPTVTETPTETPTPTPTSDPYFYYNTLIYSCGLDNDCPDPSSGSAILRFSTAQTDTWFVNAGTAYQITSITTGPAYNFDADFYNSSNDCISVCNI